MSAAQAIATAAQVALELIRLAVEYAGPEEAQKLLSAEVASVQLRAAEAALKAKLLARELDEASSQLMVQELLEELLDEAPDTEREP